MVPLSLVCVSTKVVVSDRGELEVTFITASQTWRLVTERRSIIVDEWQYVELSWHQEKGAYLHIAKRRLVPALTTVHSHPLPNVSHSDDDDVPGTRNDTSTVYIGSFDTQSTSSPSYFNVLIDELSIWFADRDHVEAFGFLEDGK